MNFKEKNTVGQIISAFASPHELRVIYIKFIAWFVILFVSHIFSQMIGTIPFLLTGIHLVLTYLVLDVAFDVGAHTINFIYHQRTKRQGQRPSGFAIGITRLSRVFFFFIFGLFVINVFVPIQTFFGSITITIAVAGLAFRDSVTNFVSGINIMFSGKFNLGEYVRIGQVKGRITDITFTHVHLQTDSQDIVFVPNNLVLAQEVTNFSKNKSKNIFVPVVVDRLQYEHYLELQEYLLQEVSRMFTKDLVSDDGIKIRVDSIDRESTTWFVEYHVSRYDFALEIALKNFTAETVIAFVTQKAAEKQAQEQERIDQTSPSDGSPR